MRETRNDVGGMREGEGDGTVMKYAPVDRYGVPIAPGDTVWYADEYTAGGVHQDYVMSEIGSDGKATYVNYLVPEGPRLAKGLVTSPVIRSLCLAHLVLTSYYKSMLLDCAIACVPRYMGLRTQHRVIDKTRFLL